MVTNNSLKEYYVKLQELYNNAVNILTAMNQSLSTSASQVTVTLTNADNTESTIKIPSFIYLENKVEQLDNNFSNLFNMPESGEAWFSKSADMFKLQMLRANSSPVIPTFSTSGVVASLTDNNFLKDLVSPKTYLKLNIDNLPDNIEKMFMKKFIFNDESTYTAISNRGLTSYEEYVAALYSLTKGVDYEEYDSEIQLPIKSDLYDSQFQLLEFSDLTSGNPWTDESTGKLRYKIVVDTVTYTNKEDNSITYTLVPGDYICIGSELAIYKVINVSSSEMSVIIEEYIGHINLQTFEENSSMVFTLYNEDYSDYHYVQIPLEENQYICVFLGTIYNNVRSILSAPYLVDLSTIKMTDAYGNAVLDSNGNQLNYIQYYEKYCTNIGDLILGLTESAYPQISNYTGTVLQTLQDNEVVQQLVTNTINIEDSIKVVPINKHLIDNTTTETIINLNSQKSELNSQLASLQANIDQVYSSLISTDWSQQTTVTQESLQSQLKEYYTQRTTLQKQYISVVDNINSSSADVTIAAKETKYRVRGITDITQLNEYIHGTLADSKLDVIGLEVEYKYKSVTKDTTSVTTINSNVFTDWTLQGNIDRQRQLVFNSTTNSFDLEFVDYGTTQNIIKWNQIDIPIVQGEDVVLRIRYKYNVGQPFVNVYSPWSDEFTVTFPTEYEDSVEISSILDTNEDDTVSAKFNNTLINDGYQEHINNQITVNNTTFYHNADNIYSGFNTSDNNYMSLKEKLTLMTQDIETYKGLIDSEVNKKFSVYLTYDDKSIELHNTSINKISLYNNDHISDAFIKKSMNIVIKNTGENNIRFYSIFPGNTEVPLLLSSDEFYDKYIVNYERVPLVIDSENSYQTLGQWIYFRQTNPFTSKSIYYTSENQNLEDYRALETLADKLTFTSINNYMKKDYNQVLLGYRKRNTGNMVNMIDNTWIGLKWINGSVQQLKANMDTSTTLEEKYSSKDISFFQYYNDKNNNYLIKFEDICGTSSSGNTVYLDKESSISEFISSNDVLGIPAGESTFIGAFLYPDITGRSSILTGGGYNDYVELEVGKSLSVPITFEYYIDGENVKTLTKALYFDIRDSLITDPKHYMLEVSATYDYTSTGSLMNSTALVDEATD